MGRGQMSEDSKNQHLHSRPPTAWNPRETSPPAIQTARNSSKNNIRCDVPSDTPKATPASEERGVGGDPKRHIGVLSCEPSYKSSIHNKHCHHTNHNGPLRETVGHASWPRSYPTASHEVSNMVETRPLYPSQQHTPTSCVDHLSTHSVSQTPHTGERNSIDLTY